MSSESLSASSDEFFRIAEELVLLTKDEALIVAEAVKKTGQSPEQIALQKGFLTAAHVDIIETLLHPRDAVPGYEILDVLGQGGMGVVYQARQLNLNRIVALKTILLSRMSDKSASGRFEQEARTVGKLRHPNIIAAYDFGRHEGRLFLAMELVEGEDVDSLLRDEGRLDEATAWGIARQTAAGLAHANRLGVVHRDIKPANLLLVEPPDGFVLPPNIPMVKIADFGLAFLADDQQAHTRLTSDNAAVGSPHYMAPEQLTETDVDFRADIYALGATVYHMLAGRPPFGGLNLSQIIAQKLSGEMRKLSERCPEVSEATCHLVQRMLARNPDDRPSDYQSLLHEMDQLGSVIGRTSSLLPALPAAPVSESAGVVTDVVSLQDTHVMVASGRAADVPATDVLPAPSAPVRPDRRVWITSAAASFLLLMCFGLWWVSSHREIAPQPIPMRGSGSDFHLFFGTSTAGWRNNHGNWVAARDEEQANVLAGTNGEAIRPLPLKPQPDGTGAPFQFYRLTLEIDPHQADAVEVRFGAAAESAGSGPQYVLRLEESGMTLGERNGEGEELRVLAPPQPLKRGYHKRHTVRMECQPTGWFVTIDGQALPGLPRRPLPELHEFRLAVEQGPAWFSDIFIEELEPVDASSPQAHRHPDESRRLSRG
ncbi:MAG: serine/threonine protein kinase [Planctomycetaceae bacterium]|nr:serine/threonine protein kinase [Planctomycetaceae bacterium]